MYDSERRLESAARWDQMRVVSSIVSDGQRRASLWFKPTGRAWGHEDLLFRRTLGGLTSVSTQAQLAMVSRYVLEEYLEQDGLF
uniref:Uncharacterized protein n=1 Tax=uncultured prokaryote TaxID=198431 RepID=A0A0H5Q6G7_9ZZZZ|nr:hypothetical protein [uncultured prokaryote]